MKNYKILGLGLLLALGIACDSKLDVEPAQSISSEIALSTPENIQNLLVGVYERAGRSAAYGGRIQMLGDLYGATSQVSWIGTFQQPREVFNKALLVNNTYVSDHWLNAYALVNMANLVVDHIGVVEEADEQARILGEAKFLRAATYFELVRFFGLPYEAGQQNGQLGVPLVLQGVLDYAGDLTVARNTVEEVYAQVIADLNDAYNSLPPTNGVFADKYSAKALLARVYLQQGNYAEARDAANDVIENSGHALVGSFAAAFNNEQDSGEDVFAMQVTSQDGTNTLITHYADQDHGGRGGDIIIGDAYLALFDSDTDVRRSFFYTSADNGERLTNKYTNQFGNIAVIRLAEMYLVRAETNIRLGTAVGATPVADINLIRERSLAGSKPTVTLDDVLHERELELAFEGFLIHDTKRLHRSISFTGNQGQITLDYNNGRLIYPIPEREMDVNPLLDQNDEYLN
ncbi:RagB/SusD family nutrient uptake outer membrane protein [Parapedobacter sp. ISTM3]|uniref:SusD family protein n=1 Tax=Parapedobacter luteus TaxID=623280 RepID=A0A1T5EVM6_9SPHI|nr:MULTISPECIES: RagB/SusD family nutrient uptake outer membrane protein [Parapedobacter]MBK1441632.1 RagB/SusD family nutrient uptake outer membrane protein [Parapedobacter sp. ISTM3]SKB88003.1 SusD family protein [Parapedobacter luteus]